MTKRLKIILIFLLLGFSIFVFNFALAGPGETGEETRDLSIQLSSALGGVVSGIPEFIGRLYNYLIGFAGGIATVMIMIGGFIYLTAAGEKGRIDMAKNMISNALIGLFLVLGAYLILNTINPAILSLKLPEIQGIDRKEIKFEKGPKRNTAGLFCAEEASGIVTSGDSRVARGLCADVCGGEDNLSDVQESPDPRAGEGRTDVTPYCCICITPPESSAEKSALSVGFESREPGTQVGCLATENPATPDVCRRRSGTNGNCERVAGGAGDAHCTWTPTECDEDSDCAGPEGSPGEGHCWGERCFQEQLRRGEICEDLGDDRNAACSSGYCEIERGDYDYCTERCEGVFSCICDGCIGRLGRCEENEECSMGAECIESGQVDVCNLP